MEGVGSAPAPRPTCLEEEGYRKTSAHSWPQALENRQTYQTKGIESSGPGLGCLDDAVAKFERALLFLQLDTCTMHNAEAEQTSHDVQARERGGLLAECTTEFASHRRFQGRRPRRLCAKRKHTHTHTPTHTSVWTGRRVARVGCPHCYPAKGLGRAQKQHCHEGGRQIRRRPSMQ